MLDAIRAEALKLHRHRATWMMVWGYPIVIALVVIGALIYGALAQGAPSPAKPAAEWIRESTILLNFTMSAPGRFLIAGFAALMFAGEYGWNTWKLIIPARARWQLIAAKWVVAFAFVVLALVAADCIGLLGEWLGSFQGDSIPAGVTLGGVLDAHLRLGAHALVPIVYTITLAGLFAILTQSILATVILSIAVVVLEGLLPLVAIFAYRYAPGLTSTVVETLPLYHMANLNAWAKGAGLVLPFGPGTTLAMSWSASFGVLALWVVGAAVLTQLRFGRQDLN
jgi:ABC-2 type transport system permease protein